MERNNGVSFVTMNKINPKRRSMAILQEKMIDVLNMVVTVMARRRMCDFSREAIVVNVPEEKFEFVRNLGPPNATHVKIDPG